MTLDVPHNHVHPISPAIQRLRIDEFKEVRMDLGYKGKTALVTGAASPIGFGRAICKLLAEEGADIAACGRNKENLDETVAICKAIGVDAIALIFDVRDADAVDAAAKEAAEHFGRIDVLINNAGASKLQHTPFMEMDRDVWRHDIDVNLIGQMNLVHAVVPYMIGAGGGRIVNFSGGRGIPGLSTYGAAKGGVVDFTKALAYELAPHNIYLNILGPGLSPTGLIQGSDERGIQMVTNSIAQKRLNSPEDVANVTAFLASDKNSYMTGTFVHMQ
jgi:NAD(P)-dependent dehydrogenase (short-subunit alcohol dehydrogenase family)